MITPILRLQTLRNLSLALVVILGGALCRGQITNATLTGNVRDSSGAVVPGVDVAATSVETGISITTMTDAAGNYTFPRLSPSTYTLTMKKEGFKSTVISGITLLVNQQARVDARLEVGNVSTKVVVSGAAPLVETTTASVGTVIGSQQVLDLPLNVRRYGSLAVLAPGTVSSLTGPGQTGSFVESTFSETTYNANGARSASNNYLIDGLAAKNTFIGGFSVQPPPDAVQEFKIQTNTYNAAFGDSAGSTINLVTKSGTNELHGTAYEFLRNDMFDARNYFSTNKAELRRNQFGFAVGGPIRKSKTFFFVNYEGTRENKGLTQTTLVPTDAEKQGNLSSSLTGQTINLCGTGGPPNLNFDSGQIFDPSTESLFTCPSGSANAGSVVLTGTPIPGNIITTIDPVAKQMLSFVPSPNRAGVPNFVNQQPRVRNDTQIVARVDHVIGPKDQLSGRYILGQTYIFGDPSISISIIPAFASALNYRGQNVGLTWTHTFGPHLLNEARFGFQREVDSTQCKACPLRPGTIAGLGIKNLTALSPALEGLPFTAISNFTNLGDNAPLRLPGQYKVYGDQLMWTHGRHSVTVGADLQFWQVIKEVAPFPPFGYFQYDGRFSSLAGSIPGALGVGGLADFLQGFPFNARRLVSTQNGYYVGGSYLSFYGQDDFKINRNLTLNIGLRYEYRRPPTEKNGNMLQFVPLGPAFSGPGNGILVSAAPDAKNDAFCTDPFYSYLKSANGTCLVATSAQRSQLGFTGRAQSALVFPDKTNFAPRLGLAWRPFESDKFVIRTGGGLFYDSPNVNQQLFAYQNPLSTPTPIYNTVFGAPPPLTNGVPTTIENAFVSESVVPPINTQLLGLNVDRHLRTPVLYEWSFGFQSQLAQNWGLEIDYIGNKGTHLDNLRFFGNQPRPGVGDLQPRRPYPDFNVFQTETFNANSTYNAVQASLTKRFSKGLTFLTAYTFGKALSDADGDEDFYGPGLGTTQDDNNLAGSKGRFNNDVRHRLVFSYVWQLPVGKGNRFLNEGGVVNAVLGGWELTGILTLQTGFPLNIAANDYSNTGTLSMRPDRVPGCKLEGPKTVNEWFNTSCFTVAALQQALASGHPRFGDAGRNILNQPGINNLDFAVLKHFPIGDRFRLEFRAEFFNFFNTPHFGPPVNQVESSSFGVITSAGEPRDIQFGLKLSF